MGEFAHVSMFAHRTRRRHLPNIHVCAPATRFHRTEDNRRYRYRMVRRDLTNGVTDNILFATRQVEGTTLSLIACTKPNFQPTSTAFRIIVTGELVDWVEL